MNKKDIKLLCRLLLSAVLSVSFVLPLVADSSYIVQKGDTLYSIARRYELTVGELRTANNFADGDVLKAGQRLIIPQADITAAAACASTPACKPISSGKPSGKQYTVQKGDTLYGIALKYNMKLSQLLALNSMGSDAVIKVGQKIAVDGSMPAPASPAPAPSSAPKSSPAKAPAAETIKRGDSNLLWPVQNPSVTYVKGKVSGVDLTADSKEDVKSIRSGTVMYTGLYRGYGSVVFVESKTGLIYAYTKLGSVSVNKGDYVVCGDTVGTVGSDSTGKNRLTLMVFQNGNPMDPAKAPRG